jgi:hypothetical protein
MIACLNAVLCFVMRKSNTQKWDDAVTRRYDFRFQTIASHIRRDGGSLARPVHAAPDKDDTAHRAWLGERTLHHVFCGLNHLEHCFETAAACCVVTNGVFWSFGSLAGSNA